jgi:hypothetical protein
MAKSYNGRPYEVYDVPADVQAAIERSLGHMLKLHPATQQLREWRARDWRSWHAAGAVPADKPKWLAENEDGSPWIAEPPEDVRERIDERVASFTRSGDQVVSSDQWRSMFLHEWRAWLADGERARAVVADSVLGESYIESFVERHLLEAKPSWLLTDEDRALLRERFREPGPYEVVLVGAKPDAHLWSWLEDNLGLDDALSIEDDVRHIGPRSVAEGVSKTAAIKIKTALEERGARVRIKEAVRKSAGRRVRKSAGRREAISQAVRREVWRRDGGRCVDCGSQERLEFDHIIPVSKGGSNTARNLELRCESCNRRKGAQI